MTDEQKLDLMANRGTPAGSVALMERVRIDGSLDRHHEPRRMRGLVVAAATFVVVLLGGLLLGWFRAPLDFITETEIDWMEVDETSRVVAGPGGIIRIDYDSEARSPIVDFSADGRTWTPANGLSFDQVFVREVLASKAGWLALVTDNTTVEARTSPDGVSWSEVILPDALMNSLDSIAASPEGFLATGFDFFGVGATVWWSSNGVRWEDVTAAFPGDVRQGILWSSNGGIIWRSLADGTVSSLATMHITSDGRNWIEMTATPSPDEFGVGSEFELELVEYIGDQWIAIWQVYLVDADPQLVVWTSPDGSAWTFQGVPPFGTEPGSAVSVSSPFFSTTDSVVGNALVVAPWTIPATGGAGAVRHANGSSSGTGELWITSDGQAWHRELCISGTITGYAATVTDDGSLAGVWTRFPEETAQGDNPDDHVASPTTTRFEPDPEGLDPVGQALQNEILADGTVTREEFEQAASGWKDCMQDFGFDEASFEIHPSGGWSRGWSADPNAGEEEDAFCDASYVARVLDGLQR